MAMNKKEQAALQDAIDELALVKAMAWRDECPQPLTREEIREHCTGFGGVTNGWFQNAHSKRVTSGCSTGISHNPNGGKVNMSQGYGRMYNTVLDAYKAMRHEVMRNAAKDLAEIDRRIAALEGE